jgi:3-phosphoshikimate 1-carboxyvinyltransferase
MIVTVKPGMFEGKLKAPASKSHLQRALAISCLCPGRTVLNNTTFCNDVYAAVEAVQAMGIQVEIVRDRILISNNPSLPPDTLNAGESGLAFRLFACLASRFDVPVKINGKGSLLNRNLQSLISPLHQLGVLADFTDGALPLVIKGPAKGTTIHLDGSDTSQVLSGLLILLPVLKEDSEIFVKNLTSRPYIDLTISTLSRFGIKVSHTAYEHFTIRGNQTLYPQILEIEGDWSGAAFMLVAAAVAGRINLKNLEPKSQQADRKIIEALIVSGAGVELKAESVRVKKNSLKAFDFNATDCPDLFPPLVSLAVCCSGKSKIHGVHRLVNKESNRADTLVKVFGEGGIDISVSGDTMIVCGGKLLPGIYDSHNDHRIAMALAVAAIGSGTSVQIRGADCVNKSYPGFWEELHCLGVNIKKEID